MTFTCILHQSVCIFHLTVIDAAISPLHQICYSFTLLPFVFIRYHPYKQCCCHIYLFVICIFLTFASLIDFVRLTGLPLTLTFYWSFLICRDHNKQTVIPAYLSRLSHKKLILLSVYYIITGFLSHFLSPISKLSPSSCQELIEASLKRIINL